MHFTVNEAGSPHQGTRGAPEGLFYKVTPTHTASIVSKPKEGSV